MLTPRENGKRCRLALGEFLKPPLGPYALDGRTLIFNGREIFVLYSSFQVSTSQWWYGIQQEEWEEWGDRFVAFLMRDRRDVNFVMLDPKESGTLLGKCRHDYNGQKEMHIRIREGGRVYFVEWQNFSLAGRVQPLKVLLT